MGSVEIARDTEGGKEQHLVAKWLDISQIIQILFLQAVRKGHVREKRGNPGWLR